MQKTKNKNKIIIAVIIMALLILAYYIFYKNSKTYKEFEELSELEELIPYEEEKQEGKKGEEVENDKKNEDNSQETENADEMIMVHITGEVNNWGVFELPQGSRVIDAVNKAGGFTDNADTGKVNLAYVLSDGVKIYIPGKNEDQIVETTIKEYITDESGDNLITGGNDVKRESNQLVNINEATQTELETLPGIGPSTALKIISYRNENGLFSSIEDIKNVNGIGDAKFENIKELICV